MKTKAASPKKPKRNMGRRVARDILAGLHAIAADLEGDKPLTARKHTVQVVDIKAMREKMHVSQAEFARRFGINRRTLQDWEQGRSAPDQNHRSYLRVIASNPRAVEMALAAE